jgi:hypothetical protein
MEARLILLDPPAARREVKLSLPATIGRSRDAKIKLVHGQVSRVHCEFFERDGVLHVRDLGSTNGTYVGDERVGESAVPPGETVIIGAVKFRAEYEPAEDAVIPAVVMEPTATIRKAAEATFRAQPPEMPPVATASPAEPLELEPLDHGGGDDSLFPTEATAIPPVLPFAHSASLSAPPPLDGAHSESKAAHPHPVEWEELEELELAPLDEESADAGDRSPELTDDASPDSSLHIFPPPDESAASKAPSELTWRVPKPSQPAESEFELHLAASGEGAAEPSASTPSAPSQSDDDSFERFLESLEDDKPA